MKYFKRFVYLIYYLKELDFIKFLSFLNYSSEISGKSRIRLFADAFQSVFMFNISLLDYFSLGFLTQNKKERSRWVGTGYMYEYQLRMNPKRAREILSDKKKFMDHYKKFVKRNYSDIKNLKASRADADNLLTNKSGKLVLKNSHGQIGAEVEVIVCADYDYPTLIDYMVHHNYDLVEEFVVQHKDLMELSPSGLNTVRIITQLADDKVEYLGARLRISVNSPVDNLAAGNLAAPIDMRTGTVNGPGIYSDITKSQKSVHPVTGKPIEGFVIPFWREVVDLAEKAALHTPQNKSVGWDIAVTSEGPELIEGNHNWCKLLWQLPVRQGLKHELERYL